jgi:thiamine-phosphate pyrophosphorylase
VAGEPGFPERAGEVLAAGGRSLALHLRLRSASGARLFSLAARLAEIAAGTGSLVIVNDRVDVALAAGCAGVQLGGGAMEIGDARRQLGPSRLVGASVHSAAEARAARGADFLLVGTLYPSETHPGRPGAGAALLGEMRAIALPLVGIGGITPARVGAVLAAGGRGVAVVRGIWGASSPRAATIEYLSALGEG